MRGKIKGIKKSRGGSRSAEELVDGGDRFADFFVELGSFNLNVIGMILPGGVDPSAQCGCLGVRLAASFVVAAAAVVDILVWNGELDDATVPCAVMERDNAKQLTVSAHAARNVGTGVEYASIEDHGDFLIGVCLYARQILKRRLDATDGGLELLALPARPERLDAKVGDQNRCDFWDYEESRILGKLVQHRGLAGTGPARDHNHRHVGRDVRVYVFEQVASMIK